MSQPTEPLNPGRALPPRAPLWRERWFHPFMWALLVALLLLFLHAVKGVLLPFVLAGIIAYLMDPLADWLEARRVHRGAAAAIITLLLFALVVGALVLLGPLLYHQMLELATRAPTLIREAETTARTAGAPLIKALDRLSGDSGAAGGFGDMVQSGFTSFGTVTQRVLASAAGVLNVLGLLLITPIVCFYAIRDWDAALARLDQLLPRMYAPVIREQMAEINRTLAAYLRGQLTVMLLLALYYMIVLSILGLNYAILLGLLAGLLVIIPYVGTLASVSLGAAVAYSQFGLVDAFWSVLAVYGCGQICEAQLLTPRIVGKQVGLHPLWLLFGMLAGGLLLGLVGVLLAVPLTAILSVLVKFLVGRYLRSALYTEA